MDNKFLFSINDIYGSLECILFLIIFLKLIRKYVIVNEQLFKLFFWGLMLRIAGLLISAFFYSGYQFGDTFVYYRVAQNISYAISQCKFSEYSKIFYLDYVNLPFKIQCILSTKEIWLELFMFPNNKAIVLIAGVISYFTFNSYLAISFFFSLWGYIGVWLIFYTFYKKYPFLLNWLYLFIIAYPTLWFWTTGVLKDPICIGSIGILFYLFFGNIKGIYKRRSVIILGVIAAVLLFIIKDYLFYIFFISLLFSYGIWYLGRINFSKNKFFLLGLTCVIAIGSFYLITNIQTLLLSSFSENIISKILNTTKYQLSVGSEAVYDLGKISISNPLSILQYLLGALNVSLFRPYLWEVKKPIMVLTALESVLTFIMIAYLLISVRFVVLYKAFKKDRFISFSFWFVVLLALAAGSISFNFGALARYKMPFIPFFFGMFLILKSNKKSYLNSRALFFYT